MKAGNYERTDTPLGPLELEFFAEDELITIIPRIETSATSDNGLEGYWQLSSGTYGPIAANRPVDVPIWLAIELRKRNKCEIRMPPWMELQSLRNVIAAEQRDWTSFQELPFHYVEIAKLLFSHAKEDMGSNYFKIRDILTGIQCLRMNKIVQGIQQIQGPVTVTLRNLSAFECNQVRHVFLNGMDHFHSLSELVGRAEAMRSQQQTETTAAPI